MLPERKKPTSQRKATPRVVLWKAFSSMVC
jgi:hypothetical protein